MAGIGAMMFFLAVLAFAGWVIVETVRPQIGRIAFLLQYGSPIGAPLPAPSRAMVRGRSVPLRVSLPPRLRAAA